MLEQRKIVRESIGNSDISAQAFLSLLNDRRLIYDASAQFYVKKLLEEQGKTIDNSELVRLLEERGLKPLKCTTKKKCKLITAFDSEKLPQKVKSQSLSKSSKRIMINQSFLPKLLWLVVRPYKTAVWLNGKIKQFLQNYVYPTWAYKEFFTVQYLNHKFLQSSAQKLHIFIRGCPSKNKAFSRQFLLGELGLPEVAQKFIGGLGRIVKKGDSKQEQAALLLIFLKLVLGMDSQLNLSQLVRHPAALKQLDLCQTICSTVQKDALMQFTQSLEAQVSVPQLFRRIESQLGCGQSDLGWVLKLARSNRSCRRLEGILAGVGQSSKFQQAINVKVDWPLQLTKPNADLEYQLQNLTPGMMKALPSNNYELVKKYRTHRLKLDHQQFDCFLDLFERAGLCSHRVRREFQRMGLRLEQLTLRKQKG